MHLRQRSHVGISTLTFLFLSLRLARALLKLQRCKELVALIFPAYFLSQIPPRSFNSRGERPRVKQEKVRQDLLPTYYFPARAVIYSQSTRGDKLLCVRALTNCGAAENSR